MPNKENYLNWKDGNTSYTLTDDTLTIEIGIGTVALATARESGSGRSKVVASTHGFMVLPGPNGLKLNMNLLAPNHRSV